MQDLAIDNDWAQLQLQGIKVVFDHLGVRILAVTNGEFDLEKQAADYRNAIALAPDVIITIPLDAERMAPVLRAAVDRGIRLVFIDNVPTSFVHPRDYVGMVMADSYANGVASASVLIDSLRPRDEVILLHWQNRMFTTDERSRAANDTFAAHPEVKVAAQAYFSDVFEAETLTAQLLQAHPAVRGVWVVWDTPALEAHKAAHDLSREVAFATIDLGREVGARLAAHDEFVGVGAQHPFQQGVAEAMLAVAALAGIPTPPFVLVPGEKVTRQSLPRAWERVFREPFPNELGMGAKHPPAPKVATP
jgi:ribose transport system substrate-binding protein